jgi:deoxyribonuclease-4
MDVWIGPAGTPTTVNTGTIDGIREVERLGLNANEVQFSHGVLMSVDTAKEVKKVSSKVHLSIHAPYYINLLSTESKKVKASRKRILDSAERAHHMGANIIVIHAGYYGNLSKEESYPLMKTQFEKMVDEVKSNKWKVTLGVETAGKIKQWGRLDEVIKLSDELRGVEPVVDFAHLYATNMGKVDYAEILDKVSVLKLKRLHTHFSCIEWSPAKDIPGKSNERRHLPLSSGKPDYKQLAKEIKKRKLDITLISESPILEKDALVMKKLLEKV